MRPGSLAAVPLPPSPTGGAGSPLEADPLQVALWERHRIEVPLPCWPAPPGRLVRVSAQLYNRPEEYGLLADALDEELAREHAAAGAAEGAR